MEKSNIEKIFSRHSFYSNQKKPLKLIEEKQRKKSLTKLRKNLKPKIKEAKLKNLKKIENEYFYPQTNNVKISFKNKEKKKNLFPNLKISLDKLNNNIRKRRKSDFNHFNTENLNLEKFGKSKNYHKERISKKSHNPPALIKNENQLENRERIINFLNEKKNDKMKKRYQSKKKLIIQNLKTEISYTNNPDFYSQRTKSDKKPIKSKIFQKKRNLLSEKKSFKFKKSNSKIQTTSFVISDFEKERLKDIKKEEEIKNEEIIDVYKKNETNLKRRKPSFKEDLKKIKERIMVRNNSQRSLMNDKKQSVDFYSRRNFYKNNKSLSNKNFFSNRKSISNKKNIFRKSFQNDFEEKKNKHQFIENKKMIKIDKNQILKLQKIKKKRQNTNFENIDEKEINNTNTYTNNIYKNINFRKNILKKKNSKTFHKNTEKKFRPNTEKTLKSNNSILLKKKKKFYPYYKKDLKNSFIQFFTKKKADKFLINYKNTYFALQKLKKKNFQKKDFKFSFKINLSLTTHKKATKKYLILDLDETLIFSTKKKISPNSIFIEKNLYINTRPYLENFLKNASKLYNLILFTAADKIYAEKALKIIDEKNEFFILRFFRHHCVYINNSIILKNLHFFRDLDFRNVLIIDNNPEHFFCHLRNVMPIVPFFGEKDDEELLKVNMFLEDVWAFEDFRKVLRKSFHMEKLRDCEIFENSAEFFL